MSAISTAVYFGIALVFDRLKMSIVFKGMTMTIENCRSRLCTLKYQAMLHFFCMRNASPTIILGISRYTYSRASRTESTTRVVWRATADIVRRLHSTHIKSSYMWITQHSGGGSVFVGSVLELLALIIPWLRTTFYSGAQLFLSAHTQVLLTIRFPFSNMLP